MNNILLKTKTLILRKLTPDDVTQDYAEWLNDPDVNKYLSCAHDFQTIETCRDYVRSFEARSDVFLIGILLKTNNLHIGNITFAPSIDWARKRSNIGISLGRKKYWGSGLATEALSTMVNYCFEVLDLNYVHACIDTENIACVNLFVRCGFKIEGMLKFADLIKGHSVDHFAYSHQFVAQFKQMPSLYNGDHRSWYFLVASRNKHV